MTFSSFVLIGEDKEGIFLSSLQQLLAFHCQIKAVFSNTEHVQGWCHQHSIQVHSCNSSLEMTLQTVPFDYLLSINNPRILKEGELRLARKLNINYHNSLLPAYAGFNAISWALLNGETRHGVSLHVTEVDINTGHILESEAVEVLPTDTALSLNLRCVEAFHSAFSRLLHKVTNFVQLTPQHQDNSRRSYHGLYACPPNMGLLNFRQDFHSVHNLARGLQYGHLENPLGSSKVLTSSGQYLLVTNSETTERTCSRETEPGTIIDSVHDTLVVKTATDLILLSVAELNGSPIHTRKFESYALTAGSVLQSPQGPPADVMSEIQKQESFWRCKMQHYEPTMFLRQKLNVVSDVIDVSDSVSVKELTFPIFHKIPEEIQNSNCLLLTRFISFMARICGTNLVHIGLVADKSNIPKEYKALYADICPGIFEIDLSFTVKETFSKCFEAVEKYKSSHTFLKDVQYRYPELDEGRGKMHHNLVIATSDDFGQDENTVQRVLSDCNLLLVLTMNDVHIYYNEKLNCNYKHIIDTLTHYPAYVTSLCSLSSDQSLLNTDLLSAEEMAVLYPLPDQHKESEHDKPDLFTLFEKQCSLSPSATAMKTTQHTMTYSEVEKAVSQLAMLLEQNLPESYKAEKKCVGLHLPNSTAYVLSLLACLKISCPFLPLAVDLPPDRMAFTLCDAKVTTMMTTDSILYNSKKFKTLPSTPITLFKYPAPDTTLIFLQFEIDENDKVPSGKESDIPEVSSSHHLEALDSENWSLQDDCCYVMYTSGSTGKPKGVQIGLHNTVNMATAHIQAWDLQSSDTTAQFASIGFDASISEIFTALLSGGTLAVLQESERLGKEFIEVLKLLEVSVITLPPSVLNIYGPCHLPTLRKIVTAGEACMSHTAFKWTQDNPDIRFFNAYGPTETAVCATIYEFQRNDYMELANEELAIGTAIKGVHVYLLDAFMKPVPPGVVGEVYIGGAGVSGGYIGHASNKTAARFIRNPLVPDQCHSEEMDRLVNNSEMNVKVDRRKLKFSTEPVILDNTKIKPPQNGHTFKNGFHNKMSGKECFTNCTQFTLYRTGDQAFQDKHGKLTFLGRLDDQVKIRGQRVDLNEIEQVIQRHPKIEMAVVVKHRCSASSEPTIAAFVTPTLVNTSELKEYMSRALPRYMIPTYIRKLKVHNFPISINGKVNRRALETDESVHESRLNVCNSHLNKTQLTMAKLWCHVLNMEESYAYSMHHLSSFSELGGNSLHLVLMQRIIEETFHVNLSFIDISAADTIENFTDIINRRKDMLKMNETHDDHNSAEKLKKTILEDSCLNLESLKPVEDFQLSQYIGHHCRHSSVFEESAGLLKILISGVTGFLGAFLLQELLEQTDCHVVCMVRAESEAKGIGRVIENLKRYGLWRQAYFPRLAVVLGDISEDKLGIAPNIYYSLCLSIDVVFINAAKVNYNTSYYDHRQANVLGTAEFLKFALSGKKKVVFLTSSLSIFLFPSKPQDDQAKHFVMKECDVLNDPLLVEGGYGQSKWASDRLVLQALDHLPGGAIFRPARVSGCSSDGMGPKNDFFASCLIGMQEMGVVPDLSFPFDLTPVDFCAKAMVEITIQCLQAGVIFVEKGIKEKRPSRHSHSEMSALSHSSTKSSTMPRVFHLFNKNTLPFKDLFNHPSLPVLPLEEWQEKLRKLDSNSLLLPLTPFFMSSFWDRVSQWPVFDTTNTNTCVSEDTKRLVTSSRDLLEVYKRYFKLKK